MTVGWTHVRTTPLEAARESSALAASSGACCARPLVADLRVPLDSRKDSR